MYQRNRTDPYDPTVDYGYGMTGYDPYGYTNGGYTGHGHGSTGGIPLRASPPLQPDHSAYYQSPRRYHHQQFQQTPDMYYQQFQAQQSQQQRHHAQAAHTVSLSPQPTRSDALREYNSPVAMYPPSLHRSQTHASPQSPPQRQRISRSKSVPENWDFDQNISTVLSSGGHRKSSYTDGSGSPHTSPIPMAPLVDTPKLPKAQPLVEKKTDSHKNESSTRSESPVVLLPQFSSPSPGSSSDDQPDGRRGIDESEIEQGRPGRTQPTHTPPQSQCKTTSDDEPVVPIPITLDTPSPPPLPSLGSDEGTNDDAPRFDRQAAKQTETVDETQDDEDNKSLPGRTPNLIHVPSSTDTNAEMHLVSEIQSCRTRYDQLLAQIAQETAAFEAQLMALKEQLQQETDIASQTEQHNLDLERRLRDLQQEKEDLEADLEEEKEKENLGDPCRPENSLSHVYSEYPPESTVIQNLLQAQIEFYFSDYNLKRDKRFLDQVFDGRNAGFLTVDEVMKLPRVRQLCGEKEQVIKALKRSNILTVDLDRELVGRPRFEKPREKEFPFRRTVFIFGIPRDENESFVREMLEPFGSVSKVQFDHPDSLDTRIGWKFLNKPRVYSLFSPQDHSEMSFRMKTATGPITPLGEEEGTNPTDGNEIKQQTDDVEVALSSQEYWSRNVRCGRCEKVKPAEEGFYEAHDFTEILCAQCGAQLADEQINEYYQCAGKNGSEVSEKYYLGTPPRDMTKCKTALVVFASQRQASKCAYVRSRIGFRGAFATHFHLYSKIKKEIALSDSSSAAPSILHRSASVPTRSRGHHGRNSVNAQRNPSNNGNNRHHENGNAYHALNARRSSGSASVGGLYSHHRAREPDETPVRHRSGIPPVSTTTNSNLPFAWSNPKHSKEVVGARPGLAASPTMVRQSTAPIRGARGMNENRRFRQNHLRVNSTDGVNSQRRRGDPNAFRRQRSANT